MTTDADDQGSELSLPVLDNSSQATPSSGPSPRTPTTDLPVSGSPSGKSTLRERQNARGSVVKEGDLADGWVTTCLDNEYIVD